MTAPMTVLPKTRTAAHYIYRHTHSAGTRVRAAALLAAVTAGDDHPDADDHLADPAHLRHLVLAARDLTGPTWLAANGDDPDVAAFAAAIAEDQPPHPRVLDDIVSRILWTRYGPTAESGPGRATGG